MLSPGILVVRFGSIGDILLATPLLRVIRQRYPHARLNVLTQRKYVPLVADSPHLDEVIGVAPKDPLLALGARLRHARKRAPSSTRPTSPGRSRCPIAGLSAGSVASASMCRITSSSSIART